MIYSDSRSCPLATPLSFFFNDTATTEIYTLSLHDALPICMAEGAAFSWYLLDFVRLHGLVVGVGPCDKPDRKSTRLNSSHQIISYAVFCLKKKTRCFYDSASSALGRTTYASAGR